jgi:hypothetical protein
MTSNGRRSVFVVTTNKGRTADDVINMLIKGEKDMSHFESGFVVGEKWSQEILRDYYKYSVAGGHWEHPGIFLSNSSLPFSQSVYLPFYILAQWSGNADELSVL